MIRIVNISDTHGIHDNIHQRFGDLPEGDILIHAGDISNVGIIPEISKFLDWFKDLPHKHKIFIVGNHDFGFEVNQYVSKAILDELKDSNVTYLENSSARVMELKFWGSPITSPFFNWAFMRDDEYREELWKTIPNDTDIIITHSPPYKTLDYSTYGDEHCGCKFLKSRVLEINPLLHIFGHIHGEYGTHEENGTLYINASTLNEKYRVSNKPIVVDIDIEKRTTTLVS